MQKMLTDFQVLGLKTTLLYRGIWVLYINSDCRYNCPAVFTTEQMEGHYQLPNYSPCPKTWLGIWICSYKPLQEVSSWTPQCWAPELVMATQTQHSVRDKAYREWTKSLHFVMYTQMHTNSQKTDTHCCWCCSYDDRQCSPPWPRQRALPPEPPFCPSSWCSWDLPLPRPWQAVHPAGCST